jgi:hypothetical protein
MDIYIYYSNLYVLIFNIKIIFYLFEGTAHCANMYPSSEQDISQLKEARIQIKGLIEQWLKN